MQTVALKPSLVLKGLVFYNPVKVSVFLSLGHITVKSYLTGLENNLAFSIKDQEGSGKANPAPKSEVTFRFSVTEK